MHVEIGITHGYIRESLPLNILTLFGIIIHRLCLLQTSCQRIGIDVCVG